MDNASGTSTADWPLNAGWRFPVLDVVWRIGTIAQLILFGSCAYSMTWGTRAGGSELRATNAPVIEPRASVVQVPEPDSADACYAALRDASVPFERVPRAKAGGVDWPIQLTGSIHGVRIYGGRKDAPTNYLDCRLALALVEWAPLLKRADVVGLQHYSMYREAATIGSSAKRSGHALGRAIDVAYFDLADGRRLSVLEDWKNRTRGVEPCDIASTSESEHLMRALACEALSNEVFQMILTPHYNDAHNNHLHLEIGQRALGGWIG